MNIEEQKAIVKIKMKEVELQLQGFKEAEQDLVKDYLKQQGKMELLESLEEQEDNNTAASNEDENEDATNN